jgi:hypothetical protein
VLLRGFVQMYTASKPCGDTADDNAGHGTHVAGAYADVCGRMRTYADVC